MTAGSASALSKAAAMRATASLNVSVDGIRARRRKLTCTLLRSPQYTPQHSACSYREERPMAHRIETITVKASPMEVFLFEPQGKGPHPGLILCQHIPGGHTGVENDKFTLETAERYAANGYAVAAPFIFHWWPKSAEMEVKRNEFRDDWTIPDLLATYELLASKPNVDGNRV